MKRLLLLLTLAPLAAHAAPDPCANTPVLAEPWTSWSQSGAAIAGGTASSAPRLVLGKPVNASLRPGAQVQFPVPPAKPQLKSYGGLFALSMKTPARIGIALSDGAWVDVINGTASFKSTGHAHGPSCSGIRKIVWFDLPQGLHAIQISGAAKPAIRIMAADALANQPRPQAGAP